jgi:hypothetical protein
MLFLEDSSNARTFTLMFRAWPGSCVPVLPMGTKHMPRTLKALVGVQGDALIAMGQMLAEISAHSRATAVNGEGQRAQNDMQVARAREWLF